MHFNYIPVLFQKLVLGKFAHIPNVVNVSVSLRDPEVILHRVTSIGISYVTSPFTESSITYGFI